MRLRAFVPFPTYPDANSEATARHSAIVAAHIEADVSAVGLYPDIPELSNPVSDMLINLPAMAREAEASCRSTAARLLAAMSREAAVRNVSIQTEEVQTGLEFAGEFAGVHARYFDMSLVGWKRRNNTALTVAKDLIFSSGRPTILLPEESNCDRLSSVAIAWDGSQCAARAVSQARPFLARAESIVVLTVSGEKVLDRRNPGQQLADSLVAARVPARFEPISIASRSIGHTLQEMAAAENCGLLVMGAYGHSRIREFVLGGATKDILNDAQIPVLMTH